MKINVKDSTIVCPAEDTPHERLWVSNLDLIHTRYHLPTVYLYEPNGSSNTFDVQVLKEALSKVLVPFYPAAGRLALDANGRIEIDCNAKGALFIEAETDSPTSDLGDFMPSPELRQLVPTIDYSDITLHPLVLFQITKFSCGGVCLGVAFHHTVADGQGALHFINSWASLARGQPISCPPRLDRTILRARDPPRPTFHHVEYDQPPALTTPAQDLNPPTSMANLKITPDQLNTLKAQVNSVNGTNNYYSTFQILTAHIWRCATKARGLSNDQKTKLSIGSDGRSRLVPPLPQGYFGNVIFHATPIALAGDLVTEPLLHTVERLDKAIKRMDDSYLRSAIDRMEEIGDLTPILRGSITSRCPNLTVASWMRLPFYEADFGWGRPLLLRPANACEGKGYLYSSPANDGTFSLAICLEAHHLTSFEKLFYEVDKSHALKCGVKQRMKINIKESTIVCPAKETPQRRLCFSNLDLLQTRYHLPTVLLYEPNDSNNSNMFDAHVLKEALSKVLVPFYPAAGRLAKDENGRIEIDCNAKGVLFIEAETDSPTSDLGDFMPGPELCQLVPTVDDSDITLYPLVLLQVTKFSCGGVCLGSAISHALVDGEGALNFINSWASLARGLSSCSPPYVDRTILRARDPPRPTFHHIEYDQPPTLNIPAPEPKPTSMTNLKITPEQLNTLRSKVNNANGTETYHYSTYQILTAHIWRCVTKARGLPGDQATKLSIATNGRSRLNPPLPPGYFGNVIFHAIPLALAGDLVSESLLHTVERIDRAIRKMDDNYLRSAMDRLEEIGDLTTITRGPNTCRNPNLNVVNWTRLPFYEADFGWGKPLFLRPTRTFEGTAYLYSSPANDRSFLLAICLEADHVREDDMKINIKESTIVRPAEDTPHKRLWVSNLDLIHTKYFLPTVYLYEPSNSSNLFDAQVLKEALSKVLVPFYPAAGRLAKDENSRFEIDCNAKGVLFIEAETDSPTSELGDFMPSPELSQLVPRVDSSSDISLHPLVLLQITKFSCGGMCLGVGWHHTLADGQGALNFINSWASLARGQSICIPPHTDRTIHKARDPPRPTFHHIEYDQPPTLNTPAQDPKPTSMTNLKITPDQLNTLKSKVNNVNGGGNKACYSTYQILTAYIWRCATKARGLSNDQATRLGLAVDGRSRLDPPPPPGYFGNVIFHASPLALVGDLVSESLLHTVERIDKAIKKMDDSNYLRSAIDRLEEIGDLTPILRGPKVCNTPNLTVNSWTRLPFYEADFGWGRPLLLRPTRNTYQLLKSCSMTCDDDF
ncbi:hypothetical protein Tsubulata_029248, partial [Turnera subulata]